MELFKKKDSRFYWYDFKLRGKRYRRSTKETNKKRAAKIAALRLSQAMGGTGLLDRKAPRLQELPVRFLSWVESATLAEKSKAYYGNGWRLLSTTKVAGMRLDHITKDDVEPLSFSGSASNANCALRTLRRILHKAEEWNLIGRVPKFKLLTEHGRRLRLDEDAEQKLMVAAKECNWKQRHLRAVPRRHHPCEEHRNAEPARALPHSHGEPRLEQPNYLCAGQQDG